MGGSFPAAPAKVLAASHWLWMGHCPIPEPITVTREIQCSDWPDLNHVPLLEPMGGAGFQRSIRMQSWRASGLWGATRHNRRPWGTHPLLTNSPPPAPAPHCESYISKSSTLSPREHLTRFYIQYPLDEKLPDEVSKCEFRNSLKLIHIPFITSASLHMCVFSLQTMPGP